MYTYISAFVILLLVFSITIAVTWSQPAAASLPQGTASQTSFLGSLTGGGSLFGGTAYSAGGSHPNGSPKDNYQCYFESCGSFLGSLFGPFSGSSGAGQTSNSNYNSNSATQGANSSSVSSSGNTYTDSINFGVFGQQTSSGQTTYGSPTQVTSNGPAPRTFILQGPDQTKSFILDKVTFKFGGYVQNYTGNYTFETRLLGGNTYDTNWVSTTKKEVTYNVDTKGTATLTFEVRAKTNDGRIDPNPPSWTFQVVHSQNWRDVRIGTISPSTNPSNENVSLYNQSNQSIDVTGWQLSDVNSIAYIGQAINVLQPVSGYNTLSDIVMPQYGSVTVTTGVSPYGFSWRDNSCTYQLNTSTPLDNNTNYSNCYFQKNQDDDFLKGSFRTFLGLGTSVWDQHSTFFVYDKYGAVVDVRTY